MVHLLQNIADNFMRRSGNSILHELMRTAKPNFVIKQRVYKEVNWTPRFYDVEERR